MGQEKFVGGIERFGKCSRDELRFNPGKVHLLTERAVRKTLAIRGKVLQRGVRLAQVLRAAPTGLVEGHACVRSLTCGQPVGERERVVVVPRADEAPGSIAEFAGWRAIDCGYDDISRRRERGWREYS